MLASTLEISGNGQLTLLLLGPQRRPHPTPKSKETGLESSDIVVDINKAAGTAHPTSE